MVYNDGHFAVLFKQFSFGWISGHGFILWFELSKGKEEHSVSTLKGRFVISATFPQWKYNFEYSAGLNAVNTECVKIKRGNITGIKIP